MKILPGGSFKGAQPSKLPTDLGLYAKELNFDLLELFYSPSSTHHPFSTSIPPAGAFEGVELCCTCILLRFVRVLSEASSFRDVNRDGPAWGMGKGRETSTTSQQGRNESTRNKTTSGVELTEITIIIEGITY